MHATNAGDNPYYRTFQSLPDNLNFTGKCFHGAASGRDYECFPCVYDQYGFGWAIQVTAGRGAYQLTICICKYRCSWVRKGSESANAFSYSLVCLSSILWTTPVYPRALTRWSIAAPAGRI